MATRIVYDIIKCIEDPINNSVSYCACVVKKLSDDFYDDRCRSRRVEIHLKVSVGHVRSVYRNCLSHHIGA